MHKSLSVIALEKVENQVDTAEPLLVFSKEEKP